MAFYDLREFIDAARKLDDVLDVRAAHWNLEIGGLVEIFANRDDHPLLLFDDIVDYPKGWRIASNLVNHPRRGALALGLPHDVPKVEMLKRWKQRLPNVRPVPPRQVKDAPLFENSQSGADINVLKFPAPHWHELDGGRYLGTACCLITREPTVAKGEDSDDGWVNVGIYRLQVHDERTLGCYISPGHHARIIREKYWAQGKSCPVAVVFGQEPALWIAAGHSVSYGASEYDFAGWIRDEPVDVIPGPITGLPLPATAEIAIEGEIPPPEEETRLEGPFGEWPGYYGAGAGQQPIIRVKAVYHRNEPILTGAPPLKPPVLTFGLPFGAAAIWQYLEKADVPDIRGVWCFSGGTAPGGGAPFAVISLTQRYAGHAQQAAIAALGCRAGAYHGRFMVVVDEDIDPADLGEVIWAISTRCDPKTALSVVDGCWSTPLDPAMHPDKKEAAEFTSSRVIINACRPYHWKDRFPPVNVISPELKESLSAKWKELLAT
jgi:4-hydroxy-3-polyprenylbenzoate decarboxylase